MTSRHVSAETAIEVVELLVLAAESARMADLDGLRSDAARLAAMLSATSALVP